EVYRRQYRAYCRIFARAGLNYLAVEAESGPIGGDASHEFMVPSPNGEDRIVHCKQCGYAANLERAESGRKRLDAVTPEADLKPLAELATPDVGSIEQVCKFLKCKPARMIKTLIYVADGTPVAVLLRGDAEVNEGKLRRALGATSLELADEATIEQVTGAPVGFAGPVGLKCRIVADHDVPAIAAPITGANKKDAHLANVHLRRDYDLEYDNQGVPLTFDLRNADADDPCPRCLEKLTLVHGIEVGHVFKLGTKYSEALGATFLDEKEQRHPIIMGCYGIGVNRIIAAAAETSHDEDGLIWPLAIAPYEVLLIPLNVTDAEVMATANRYYDELRAAGVDVLFDDRDARPGFKFKDADLIGIPLRVVIGGRGLQEGQVEIKWRTAAEPEKAPVEAGVRRVVEMLAARRAEDARGVPA
ncbi:MAG: proline--tRNA ligase, partial [Planctomycetales bacterium]